MPDPSPPLALPYDAALDAHARAILRGAIDVHGADPEAVGAALVLPRGRLYRELRRLGLREAWALARLRVPSRTPHPQTEGIDTSTA